MPRTLGSALEGGGGLRPREESEAHGVMHTALGPPRDVPRLTVSPCNAHALIRRNRISLSTLENERGHKRAHASPGPIGGPRATTPCPSTRAGGREHGRQTRGGMPPSSAPADIASIAVVDGWRSSVRERGRRAGDEEREKGRHDADTCRDAAGGRGARTTAALVTRKLTPRQPRQPRWARSARGREGRATRAGRRWQSPPAPCTWRGCGCGTARR